MSPLISGLASLPMAATIMLTAPQVARLLPKVGPRVLMTIGPLLAAAGLLWFSRITVDGAYVVQVLPGQILLGIGLAFVFVPMQTVALSGIEPRDAGVAGAALTGTQQIGGSLGTAVFTALFASAVTASVTDGVANPLQQQVDGYHVVFLAAAIGVACASLKSWSRVRVPLERFREGASTEAVSMH